MYWHMTDYSSETEQLTPGSEPTSWSLTRWLAEPIREWWLFLIVGCALWLLLFSLTKWAVDGWWNYLPVLIADLYLLALAVCALPKRVRPYLFALVYITMYATGFAESFVYQRYFTHLTPQTLMMIRETTPSESEGFLNLCLKSPVMWNTLMWWGILLSCHIVAALLCRKIKASRRVVRIGWGVVAVCVLWWVPSKTEIVRFLLLDSTVKAESVDNKAFYSTPWRAVYSLKFEQLTQSELKTLSDNMSNISVGEVGEGVPLIVLVIGESYNKHHSAVYGYELNTTPFQSKCEADGLMVAMSDAVTPWNITSMAFKEMMSTHSSDQPGRWTDGVLFPALMRQAGYRVSFLTNQFYKSKRQMSANFNGSFFLNTQPFDSLCFDYRNTRHYRYDIGLLKELPKEPIAGKQFFIIHLLGQHQPYSDRLPKSRRTFKESDIKRPDLSADERMTVAEYDDATKENDRVMKAIYERFAQREAIIIYVADHGEEVYDGNIGMFGRNHSAEPTPAILRGEFEVPLEVFVTPMLNESRPELMESLREAKDRPFAIDDLPHMLMRLGGVRGKYYDAGRDLLSPNFKARKRPVKDTGLSYDQIIAKE